MAAIIQNVIPFRDRLSKLADEHEQVLQALHDLTLANTPLQMRQVEGADCDCPSFIEDHPKLSYPPTLKLGPCTTPLSMRSCDLVEKAQIVSSQCCNGQVVLPIRHCEIEEPTEEVRTTTTTSESLLQGHRVEFASPRSGEQAPPSKKKVNWNAGPSASFIPVEDADPYPSSSSREPSKEDLSLTSRGNTKQTEKAVEKQTPSAKSAFFKSGRAFTAATIFSFDSAASATSELQVEEEVFASRTTEIPQHYSRCMLSPIGKPRLVWDVLWCLVLCYDMWWALFLLVFISEHDGSLDAFDKLSFTTFCFWVCDIVLNFFTGFVAHNVVVLNRRATIRKYAHGWLWFDLVATFPFDKIINATGGSRTVSMIRMGKASKTLKLVKAMRLIRAVRVLQLGRKRKNRIWLSMEKHTPVIGPFVLLAVFLALYAHAHGCAWASLHPDWQIAVADSRVAFERYRISFWWAYTAVTFGTQVEASSFGQSVFEAFICAERLVLLGGVCMYGVLKTMIHFQNHAQLTIMEADSTAYLKDHDVGAEAQIQVLYTLHETAKAHKQQSNFNAIMQGLPSELRRTINTELWSPRIETLELFTRAEKLHSHVIVEIAQFVKEEVFASNAVVCREGDPAISAYFIIKGCIQASRSNGESIPPFKAGSWFGERALVSLGLHRSATAICKCYTVVMTVPGRDFHHLLEGFGVQHRFRAMCKHHLPLCGRCGKMGLHDADDCPSIEPTQKV